MTTTTSATFDPYLTLEVRTDITPKRLRIRSQSRRLTPEQDTAYQLLCDTRYRRLFEKEGWETVVAAGFITSSLDPDFSLDRGVPLPEQILTKVKNSSYSQDENATVLLMTGAFGPAHRGHVNAMELARQKAEERGQKVVAGLLSPTHQDYVRTKRVDAGETSSRIVSCVQAVQEQDWLEMSPWESMYAFTYHNFTTVIDYHLKALAGVMKFPHITYVFGEDNKDFSLVFEDERDWICVERPQVEILSQQKVNLVPNNYAMSSTWVREGKRS